MTDNVLPFSRGGMCSNPFGGEDRIDRINLFDYLEPNVAPDKVLYSRIIQDAASNYLYAFLGKNGTSAEEFFSAWQYFFKVTSSNRKSWDHHRTIKLSYTRKGRKITENRYLNDNELQLMCFDKHYDYSGLAEHMHIDKFRSGLKAKRRKILIDNWQQVQDYVQTLYSHELSQITDGQQVPLQVWNESLLEVLVDPPSPLHLASVIYVPNKLKRSRKPRAQKPQPKGIYARLVEKLQGNKFQPLDANWGPLALLGATTNDKAVNNDSGDSVHSHADRCGFATSPSDCWQATVEGQSLP